MVMALGPPPPAAGRVAPISSFPTEAASQAPWPSAADQCALFIFQCKWSRKGFIRTRWCIADWYVHCGRSRVPTPRTCPLL